ncbi:DUF3168 domain-containing protein [Thalassospira sp. MCCC 1A01428]|uniref:DUF3168 domain-containing protein n=1 Tax=Thalassospira sp. MCCC 1A01428 TaxID=1470575 RepID=UPI000A21A2CB|nr:DUF3168 domain-containing protein [Thalassospira sp. MCCC 1A01428]OSQ33820.1 hypothetical protein THS27_25900 [Thalassospira sp. MCCC 1A01428]
MVASIAVQAALYAALTDALSCPVYEAVPVDATMPYVVFDNNLVLDADYISGAHERITFYLSVYSDYAGSIEVRGILGVIKATLHQKRLALADGVMEGMAVTRSTASPDIADDTFMGSCTVDVRVQP